MNDLQEATTNTDMTWIAMDHQNIKKLTGQAAKLSTKAVSFQLVLTNNSRIYRPD